MKISAVIIAKNEEVLLSRCLESVKGLDEIIVCDTGSTDTTVEIAKRYTDKVFTDFTWCDDFAKARNHAKSKATGDWILSIDCDETLYDVAAVREAVALAEMIGTKAVDTCNVAEDNGQFFYYPRLFKNVPEVFWEGRIHNTLSITGARIGDVRIKIGYSPAHANDPDRVYRILKLQYDEHRAKGVINPRIWFYYGRELAYRGEHKESVMVLWDYVQVSNFLAEKADAYMSMARSLWELKQADEARDACMQALVINSHFAEAARFMAVLAGDGSGNERWQRNADQWKKMAETADNEDLLFVRK